jgi:hypothetical protein
MLKDLGALQRVRETSTSSSSLVLSLRPPGKQMAGISAVSPKTSMLSALSLSASVASSGKTLQVVVVEFGVADDMLADTDA